MSGGPGATPSLPRHPLPRHRRHPGLPHAYARPPEQARGVKYHAGCSGRESEQEKPDERWLRNAQGIRGRATDSSLILDGRSVRPPSQPRLPSPILVSASHFIMVSRLPPSSTLRPSFFFSSSPVASYATPSGPTSASAASPSIRASCSLTWSFFPGTPHASFPHLHPPPPRRYGCVSPVSPRGGATSSPSLHFHTVLPPAYATARISLPHPLLPSICASHTIPSPSLARELPGHCPPSSWALSMTPIAAAGAGPAAASLSPPTSCVPPAPFLSAFVHVAIAGPVPRVWAYPCTSLQHHRSAFFMSTCTVPSPRLRPSRADRSFRRSRATEPPSAHAKASLRSLLSGGLAEPHNGRRVPSSRRSSCLFPPPWTSTPGPGESSPLLVPPPPRSFDASVRVVLVPALFCSTSPASLALPTSTASTNPSFLVSSSRTTNG
ncbi:hypothetical protein B0H14DRAFT_3907891 [Mycena olivaceomarginata]|nr:hypothetical protein B0H14DRAFT_3907891 [Mycena olivaceomarginata]